MGNSSKKPEDYQIVSGYNERQWRVDKAQTLEHCSIWNNVMMDYTAEVYEVKANLDSSELDKYTFRNQNNRDIVGVYYVIPLDGQYLCSKTEKMQILTQRIPTRLLNVNDLTENQALHVLNSAYSGYNTIGSHYGPVMPTETCIGFNINGKTKVWINPNFALNTPLYREELAETDQRERKNRQYTKDVFNMVDQRTIGGLPRLRDIFNQKQPTYFEAINILEHYIEATQIRVPSGIRPRQLVQSQYPKSQTAKQFHGEQSAIGQLGNHTRTAEPLVMAKVSSPQFRLPINNYPSPLANTVPRSPQNHLTIIPPQNNSTIIPPQNHLTIIPQQNNSTIIPPQNNSSFQSYSFSSPQNNLNQQNTRRLIVSPPAGYYQHQSLEQTKSFQQHQSTPQLKTLQFGGLAQPNIQYRNQVRSPQAIRQPNFSSQQQQSFSFHQQSRAPISFNFPANQHQNQHQSPQRGPIEMSFRPQVQQAQSYLTNLRAPSAGHQQDGRYEIHEHHRTGHSRENSTQQRRKQERMHHQQNYRESRQLEQLKLDSERKEKTHNQVPIQKTQYIKKKSGSDREARSQKGDVQMSGEDHISEHQIHENRHKTQEQTHKQVERSQQQNQVTTSHQQQSIQINQHHQSPINPQLHFQQRASQQRKVTFGGAPIQGSHQSMYNQQYQNFGPQQRFSGGHQMQYQNPILQQIQQHMHTGSPTNQPYNILAQPKLPFNAPDVRRDQFGIVYFKQTPPLDPTMNQQNTHQQQQQQQQQSPTDPQQLNQQEQLYHERHQQANEEQQLHQQVPYKEAQGKINHQSAHQQRQHQHHQQRYQQNHQQEHQQEHQQDLQQHQQYQHRPEQIKIGHRQRGQERHYEDQTPIHRAEQQIRRDEQTPAAEIHSYRGQQQHHSHQQLPDTQQEQYSVPHQQQQNHQQYQQIHHQQSHGFQDRHERKELHQQEQHQQEYSREEHHLENQQYRAQHQQRVVQQNRQQRPHQHFQNRNIYADQQQQQQKNQPQIVDQDYANYRKKYYNQQPRQHSPKNQKRYDRQHDSYFADDKNENYSNKQWRSIDQSLNDRNNQILNRSYDPHNQSPSRRQQRQRKERQARHQQPPKSHNSGRSGNSQLEIAKLDREREKLMREREQLEGLRGQQKDFWDKKQDDLGKERDDRQHRQRQREQERRRKEEERQKQQQEEEDRWNRERQERERNRLREKQQRDRRIQQEMRSLENKKETHSEEHNNEEREDRIAQSQESHEQNHGIPIQEPQLYNIASITTAYDYENIETTEQRRIGGQISSIHGSEPQSRGHRVRFAVQERKPVLPPNLGEDDIESYIRNKYNIKASDHHTSSYNNYSYEPRYESRNESRYESKINQGDHQLGRHNLMTFMPKDREKDLREVELSSRNNNRLPTQQEGGLNVQDMERNLMKFDASRQPETNQTFTSVRTQTRIESHGDRTITKTKYQHSYRDNEHPLESHLTTNYHSSAEPYSIKNYTSHDDLKRQLNKYKTTASNIEDKYQKYVAGGSRGGSRKGTKDYQHTGSRKASREYGSRKGSGDYDIGQTGSRKGSRDYAMKASGDQEARSKNRFDKYTRGSRHNGENTNWEEQNPAQRDQNHHTGTFGTKQDKISYEELRGMLWD